MSHPTLLSPHTFLPRRRAWSAGLAAGATALGGLFLAMQPIPRPRAALALSPPAGVESADVAAADPSPARRPLERRAAKAAEPAPIEQETARPATEEVVRHARPATTAEPTTQKRSAPPAKSLPDLSDPYGTAESAPPSITTVAAAPAPPALDLSREATLRERLEPKVWSGQASLEEVKMLRAICAHMHDRACRDRAAEVLQAKAQDP